jgi:hypothetical protein
LFIFVVNGGIVGMFPVNNDGGFLFDGIFDNVDFYITRDRIVNQKVLFIQRKCTNDRVPCLCILYIFITHIICEVIPHVVIIPLLFESFSLKKDVSHKVVGLDEIANVLDHVGDEDFPVAQGGWSITQDIHT